MNKILAGENQAFRVAVLCLWFLTGSNGELSRFAGRASETRSWKADHHVHLASAELCRLVRECLPSNHPPAVLASDAIHALDEAKVSKGVILSCAYLYGLPSLRLSSKQIALGTRRENEFTAAEVAKYPTRLVGFLSVDPLEDSALDEIRHWKGSHELIGLKVHFTASAVHMKNEAERRKVAQVVGEAAAEHLPMVIHIGGGKFDVTDAELFIREVLPSAGDSWVQIAHAGGGLPLGNGNHVRVLGTFANHIAKDDPLTRHVLFDLSVVPAQGENAEVASELMQQIRRIGIKRFFFGSDFNVITPKEEIRRLGKLGLTRDEWRTVEENCAPWVC